MKGFLTPERLTPALLAGAFGGLVVWFFGASLWWAVPIGAVVAAVVLAWRAMPALEEPRWPSRAPEHAIGGRDDVQLLGWAIAGKNGRVQPRAVDRARALAAERLAPYGLGLDAASDRDRVVALLGEHCYATLHARDVMRMPAQRDLLACLDALDALRPDPSNDRAPSRGK